MKAKLVALLFLLITAAPLKCQENKLDVLTGSWLGKVSTDQWSLRVLLRIVKKDKGIKCYLDSPDQGMKGITMDKVTAVNDSLFVDATSIGAGVLYKGRILPGDSVIEGVWGGSLSLRLARTNWVFELKTNITPEVKGYRIIKLIPTSPIKDQQGSSVCWSFATTSFMETEALRMGKNPVVLSPMFFVLQNTLDKGEKYIRMNGKSYFGPGDLTFGVLNIYRKYGAVPQAVFPGKTDTTSGYDYNDMDRTLKDKADYYVKNGRGKMTPEEYRTDMRKTMQNTMGELPDSFIYKNRHYTSKTFAKEVIGINPDDYVEVTSFTHHPFYSKFVLEIESNWNNGYYLNIPLKDFSELLDSSLLHGYSVCWDGDAYRYRGFSDGFAVLDDTLTKVTQEKRQADFDNYNTIDQHNMHIVGIAEDARGRRFYIIKNSSDALNCGGYMYMSKDYLLLRTISLMVNKHAIPGNIKRKVKELL